MSYNLIHSVEDISDESGTVTEPVTLAEMKDYLRLEGAEVTGSGLSIQEPITLTISSGNSVQSALLIGDSKVITNVIREGLNYNETTDDPPGDLQFIHDKDTGEVRFRDDGPGLSIKINYGISGSSDSTADFNFDDSLVEQMIASARERIEKYTGCSLIPKTIQAVVTNLCGNITLPSGPITGDITAVDSEGTEIVSTDIKLLGTKFPDLKEPMNAEMVLTYPAGYSTVPKGLKAAIMAEVAFRYENRGDEAVDDGVCKAAMILCNPYKRGSAFG